jgi:hypothetical protein
MLEKLVLDAGAAMSGWGLWNVITSGKVNVFDLSVFGGV